MNAPTASAGASLPVEHLDCAVIGAGVAGLAVARELAMAGREVVIIEAASAVGTGISSRSGEVVHAGIYYAPGSLKARLCVEGRRRLWDYCERRGVPHSRCGKLIPATSDDQGAALDKLAARAHANGATEVRLVSGVAARRLEPELDCRGALLSPASGIVDSHALMGSLLADAEAHGAVLARCSRVLGGRPGSGRITLEVEADGERAEVTARDVVNATGLDAPALAGRLGATAPPLVLAKGTYFALAGSAPFSRLVYPLPQGAEPAGHLTRDLGGRARAGPTVCWLPQAEAARIDYATEPEAPPALYAAVRRYWPALPEGALQPAFAGVWPHLGRGGFHDFQVQDASVHGVPGLFNLYGIDSPGLTSALALAVHVRERIGRP